MYCEGSGVFYVHFSVVRVADEEGTCVDERGFA